jgi:stage II sporulation protein M
MSEPGELPLPRALPIKNALVFTVLLFIVAMLVGWVGTAHTPAIGEQLMALFQKEVAGQITEDNPADMFAKLLANNLEACIMLFLGGASFGILTLGILGLNGIVIGSVTEIVSQGHSATFIAAALLPHGIFEIPAFIIAGALGFCMAQSLIAEWYGAGDTGEDAKNYGQLFLLYVLPLICIAAFVEAFITPAVIQLVA